MLKQLVHLCFKDPPREIIDVCKEDLQRHTYLEVSKDGYFRKNATNTTFRGNNMNINNRKSVTNLLAIEARQLQ